MTHEIRYGKADVKVYRTHAEPLAGITQIPESPFAGRDNVLAAAEVEVIVHGTQFLDAYTKGDNRLVVATDTMKNFIHAVSLRARARALEEWLFEVGTAFLDTYPHMERLTMVGRDLPFPAAVVPSADGFEMSDRLFSRDRSDYGTARLELARDDAGGVRITDHESGRRELQLIKITGSAFADFARDEHTTLPERRDRPLYIWCDIGWTYADASHAVLGGRGAATSPRSRSPTSRTPSSTSSSASRSSTSSTRSACVCSTVGRSWRRSRSTRRTASGTSERRPMTAARRRMRTRDRRSGTSAWSCAATRRNRCEFRWWPRDGAKSGRKRPRCRLRAAPSPDRHPLRGVVRPSSESGPTPCPRLRLSSRAVPHAGTAATRLR